jgi:lipopolysaccharide export system protein LptA
MLRIPLMSFVLVALLSSAAIAQTSSLPIEITAQSALEWNSEKKQYIARTDAKATQGDFSVTGDILIADYREGADGSTQIYRLTSEGNVTVTSGTSTATGNKAVYEVDTAMAVLTGDNLRMTGENLDVTAKERFEYYSNEGKLVAFGRPLVKSGTDTLEADKVTAWLDRSNKPKSETSTPATGNLKRVEADGNVVITTPTEHATSDRATYDAEKQISELIGRAVVKRDKDVMTGERAEMNMTTKVSKMFGSGTKDGRVKGVFYPAKSKKSDPKKSEASTN